MEALQNESFDCIILDYTLPDIPGHDLIQQIDECKMNLTPIIVYSAREFNPKEIFHLNQYSNTVMTKGVHSLEHLLEETVMQLHIRHDELAPDKKKVIENIRMKEDILTGKNVLVVDDDVRNLFALTTVFERYKMNVITAESGKEAIALINNVSNRIDMVLMDIMMPEMDGYETTQKIRREHKNSMLPIIAVTAKAMKGDRLKCIEAGASDYITKPLKIDQLLSLMRIWCYK
jgi:DNA-binding response OmpR family regulator